MICKTLADLLRVESIVAPMAAATPEAAIAALVAVLPVRDQNAREEIKAAVLSRETACSTGIGEGIAIPHARSTHVAAPLLAVGRAASPIDFHASDGLPVTLVFLLAVPTAEPSFHLKTLAAISRIAADKDLLRRLNAAADPRQLFDLISKRPV
jgi:mannitol/fructose-specific phosphotransferase system IIA component (Ntr-type)